MHLHSLQCLEEQDLMNIHGVSETQGINQDDFVRICPSLIRQLQKGACVKEKPGSSKVGEHSSKMSHGKLFVNGARFSYTNPKKRKKNSSKYISTCKKVKKKPALGRLLESTVKKKTTTHNAKC